MWRSRGVLLVCLVPARSRTRGRLSRGRGRVLAWCVTVVPVLRFGERREPRELVGHIRDDCEAVKRASREDGLGPCLGVVRSLRSHGDKSNASPCPSLRRPRAGCLVARSHRERSYLARTRPRRSHVLAAAARTHTRRAIYGGRDFDPAVVASSAAHQRGAIDEHGMLCPLHGHGERLRWHEGRRRSGTEWHADPAVRFHASPTYVLRERHKNLIAGHDVLVDTLSGKAETHRLGHETAKTR